MSTTSQAILPVLGEFGCYVGSYVREVNRMCQKAPTIVSCRPFDKILFPYAAGFFHDYEPEFILDDYRCGYYCDGAAKMSTAVDAYLAALASVIRARWPGVEVRRLSFPGFRLHDTVPAPDQREKDCLTISMRGSTRNAHRNLRPEAWHAVITALATYGLPIYAIGSRGSALYLDDPRINYCQYDAPGAHLAFKLICRSRLFVGTDSGPAHLAGLAGTRSLIITEPARGELKFLLGHPGFSSTSLGLAPSVIHAELSGTSQVASVSAVHAG